jgi:uncharacterized protein involved in exopolysaccharide biosynthesis
MMNQSNSKSVNSEEDSIDLILILKKLWLSRRRIVIICLIFCLIGVLIAISTPVKYTAHTSFIPQLNQKKSSSSGLMGLASLAGVDLSSMDGGSSELSPLIYPKLAQSITFNLSLLEEEIIWEDNLILRLDSCLQKKSAGFTLGSLIGIIKKYTIGLPALLFSRSEPEGKSDVNNSLITLSEQQKSWVKYLQENVAVELNEKEGYLSIIVTDSDPYFATRLTLLVADKLQKEIIAKRLEKAKDNLTFVQGQYELKNVEFERLQNKLAIFKDRNQNISTAQFMSNLQRLESEYTISLNVVQELASQVEQTKIQVNKDTPIFTVIEPVTVPSERTAPKRGMIVVIWTFLGFVLSAGYALSKDLVKDLIASIAN